jgi:signal transduction histidine kinase
VNSLRTRIAIYYGTLIVAMIVVAAIALNFAFRQILLDQAKLRVNATSDQIVKQIVQNDNLSFAEPEPVLVTLGDRANLDHWAGPSTYVQIDSLGGKTINKSGNMGSLILPPQTVFAPGTDRTYRILAAPGGTQLLVLDRELKNGTVPVAIAHVAERLDNVRALVARARTIIIIVTLVGGLTALGIAYLVASTALGPIVRLTEAMAEIGSDRLDRRIASTRTDEVGRLAQAFNAMLARLQEAFARERQFISDASHELRTPLTVINANAQMLQRWGDRDEAIRRESLAAIAAESAQLAAMVSGMLLLAKAESGDDIPRSALDLGPLARDVVAHARERAAAKGLQLDERGIEDDAVVVGDAGLLRQLIGNLVDNAIKFTDAGDVEVGVRRRGEDVEVSVADTGVGIDPDQAERLFDRFFRSDVSHTRAIEGTGLGLAIVRSIARIHGGRASAEGRPGGGSRFSVTLPAARRSVIESQ